VSGNGNMDYIGGGVLARLNFLKRLYVEASIRLGQMNNAFDSSDLQDSFGNMASYESTSSYYGLHLGLSYIQNISNVASFELYSKYFYNVQGEDSVALSTGETVEFDNVISSRLRIGGRFAYAVHSAIRPYVGLAWEHELDGKINATTNGYAIDAPSLGGSTGMGELGISAKPFKMLFINLGAQGYIGKRQGVAGHLQAGVRF
jgi:outer membrane autotransporter protein